MKRYRPSGRIPFGGLIGLILATVIGSLVIGGLVFAVSHLIYLIILFPLVMGALGGGLLALVVKNGKVRSPIIAALFGLILGVGIIGTYRFATYYIDFRNFATEEVRSGRGGANLDQEEVDESIDLFLEEETGSTGFIGFMKLSAAAGETITNRGNEVTLDENQTWIYWGVELLIVALFCAGLAFNSARQPFNEDVGGWYPDPFYVGTINWKSRKEFLDLVKNGDTNRVFQMISQHTNPAPVATEVKPARTFSIGDFISLVAAIALAIAFFVLPWLDLTGTPMSGLQLLTDVPASRQEDTFFMLAFIPIGALLGAIGGLLGLLSMRARGGARVIALIGSLIAFVYYVVFFVENGNSAASFTEMVGIGFWIGIIATIMLFIQAFFPRNTGAKSAARIDVVAYQTPTAPTSDVVLGVNSITLNRNQEVSSNLTRVLVSPQEFATLSQMVNSGKNLSPAASVVSNYSSRE